MEQQVAKRIPYGVSDFVDIKIFPSLLFYYGMLTIKEVLGNQVILGIPNNNVRKQYYGFLLSDVTR